MFLSEHIEGVWGDAQRLFHDLEIKVSPCFFSTPTFAQTHLYAKHSS